MERLRETLKLLFHQQNPKEVLQRQKVNPLVRVDEIVDASSFQKMYALYCDARISLDQANSIYRRLTNAWMGANVSLSVYSSRKTIFNALLQFSNSCLLEKDGMPVCRYEYLLRWNELSAFLGEDMLTAAFLAARDLYNGIHRQSFVWPVVINHDNRALNELLKKPLVDIHFHLNGSSLNFDLNWMSLMNKTSGWSKDFAKHIHTVQHKYNMLTDGDSREPFYLCVMKASALRLLLFDYINGGFSISAIPSHDLEVAKAIIDASTTEDVCHFVKELDLITRSLRLLYGKRYSGKDGSQRIPDYMVSDRITLSTSKNHKDFIFTVLSGERWMLYELYKEVFGNPSLVDAQVVAWFYAYLLYKSQFRTEFVQMNNTNGFANFALYEKRKSLFIRDGSVYSTLLTQMAACSFLNGGDGRFLEARITPKSKQKVLHWHVNRAMRDITDSHFVSSKVASDLQSEFGVVLHFIKKEDNEKPSIASYGVCRHHKLRNLVKKQALAIRNLRHSTYTTRNRIVGIDAANSEIYARPEVFAQAFRYLRQDTAINQFQELCKDLGMTYHVGEDFMDIVDGLRAIDETILFMGFRNGDRLGHALSLGTDVHTYYKDRHNTVLMPCLTLLDNVVWLYYKGNKLASFGTASHDMEILFETYIQKVYGHLYLSVRPSMWDYFQSWQLRGDAPECYYKRKSKGQISKYSRWQKFDFNNAEEAAHARLNSKAEDLYSFYHFDPSVRINGNDTVEVKLSESIVNLIEDVQKLMLTEIERKNICIECNPTSNLRIGYFNCYSNHPIVRMFNCLLEVDEEPHSISVSINTDDKGIFATSLEREYSLLALSLEKEYAKTGKNPPRLIYEWLDKIRQLGFEQKF